MLTRNRPLQSWLVGATAALLLAGAPGPAAAAGPAAASGSPEITGCIPGLNCGPIHPHHRRVQRPPAPPNPPPAVEQNQIQLHDVGTPPPLP